MGSWGTGILQNDTTADIWLEFRELFNQGLDEKEIRTKLEKEYRPDKNEDEYAEIWTGIAHGQWMTGSLEKYTLKKVKEILSNNTGLSVWQEDKKLLTSRVKAISEFVSKIQTPRSKPLIRKKVVSRPSFFRKGDVISIQIDAQKRTAAIVVENEDDSVDGSNTIVFTDLIKEDSISLDEVKMSNIIYLDKGGAYDYHRGFFDAIFSARNMARKMKNCEKIGRLNFSKYLRLGVGMALGDWNKVSVLYLQQIEFLKSNKTSKPFNVSVKEFLSPTKELENKLIELSKRLTKEWLLT